MAQNFGCFPRGISTSTEKRIEVLHRREGLESETITAGICKSKSWLFLAVFAECLLYFYVNWLIFELDSVIIDVLFSHLLSFVGRGAAKLLESKSLFAAPTHLLRFQTNDTKRNEL